jgi:hypothetical protein
VSLFIDTSQGRITVTCEMAEVGLAEMRKFHSLCHGIGYCIYDNPRNRDEGALVTDMMILMCGLAPIILAGLGREEISDAH